MKNYQQLKFFKMHGLGNDFIFIEEIDLTNEQIITICNPKYGMGCDQLFLFKYQKKKNNVKVKIFNSDGSVAENCGNGVRCMMLLLNFLHNIEESTIFLENGTKLEGKILSDEKDCVLGITKDVYAEIGRYKFLEENNKRIVVLSNKHLVHFVDSLDEIDMVKAAEESVRYDANISFAEKNNENIIVRVYERGVGETHACGSAAAAVYGIFIANESQNNAKMTEKCIFFKKSSNSYLIVGHKSDSKGDIIYTKGSATLVAIGNFFIKIYAKSSKC